jgi:hypothetical protein
MKKLICLFGLSALLLTSCSSSDSSSTTEESDVLVTRTVETYANDGSTVTTNYTYSGKKVLKSIDSDGYYENYTYTGDLLTKAEIFDMDDNLIQRETFTYNGSAQLVSYVILDFEFNMGDKETYVHNSDGTISTAAFSGDLTSQTNPVSTGVVHFANGEVSSFDEIESFSSSTSTTTYTYDTKNNPFKNITGYDKISFIDSEAAGNTHNILTKTYTTSSQTDVTTTTFTYNSLNFPVTDSEIEGTDATSVITTQYTYN